MLKRFLLNALSSFVGAWIAIVLSGIVIVFVVLGIMARLGEDQPAVQLKNHSILTIDLQGVIEEAESSSKPDLLSLANGDFERPQSLMTIIRSIRAAENNKYIDAIYLKCGAVAASPATMNAIRAALSDFKKSGKHIFAYADGYTTGTYYVASVADKVYLNSGGTVMLQGLSSTAIYMKSLLDKLGIGFQVIKVGTFKSAVEPYIMDRMSEPARAQLDTLFGTMWGYMKDRISADRKALTPEKIDSLINKDAIGFSSAVTIRKCGLVDDLLYERQVDDTLAKYAGVEKKKLNFISPAVLDAQEMWGNGYGSKNQIALLYATGEIVDGASTGINFQRLVPIIVDLAEDDNVKGLVLRVNSPGGSAFGSEQIGEALDFFKSKGKTLAVSMGDYAASGGYWISAGADKIFADPLTITGSIGIFGLIPNVQTLTDKIGINVETVSTNPEAQFPDIFHPMNETQLNVMQKYVERGYDQFVNRVAKGRGMSVESVKRIAEGRVWSAITAEKIGLVDSLASLHSAIEWTAGKAGIGSKYKLSVYPRSEFSIWEMLPSGGSGFAAVLGDVAREKYEKVMAERIRMIFSRSRIMAIMPEFKVSFSEQLINR